MPQPDWRAEPDAAAARVNIPAATPRAILTSANWCLLKIQHGRERKASASRPEAVTKRADLRRAQPYGRQPRLEPQLVRGSRPAVRDPQGDVEDAEQAGAGRQ